MKIVLNQNIVLKLNLESKPSNFVDGRFEYDSNLNKVAYTIFDSHRDAPTGFGVKIAKTKKLTLFKDALLAEKSFKLKLVMFQILTTLIWRMKKHVNSFKSLMTQVKIQIQLLD